MPMWGQRRSVCARDASSYSERVFPVWFRPPWPSHSPVKSSFFQCQPAACGDKCVTAGNTWGAREEKTKRKRLNKLALPGQQREVKDKLYDTQVGWCDSLSLSPSVHRINTLCKRIHGWVEAFAALICEHSCCMKCCFLNSDFVALLLEKVTAGKGTGCLKWLPFHYAFIQITCWSGLTPLWMLPEQKLSYLSKYSWWVEFPHITLKLNGTNYILFWQASFLCDLQLNFTSKWIMSGLFNYAIGVNLI
jgi:hypothetical protein